MVHEKLMNIITILGDSLSMARDNSGIGYKNTYSYLLNKNIGGSFLVLNKAKRTNTVVNQSLRQHIIDDILTTEAIYYVIQLGIVDCAPRIISIFEKRILKLIKITWITKSYIKLKSNNREFFTKYFKRTYVPIDIFEQKYRFILKTIESLPNVEKIILINIADTNQKNKSRSFNFESNILKYNKVIEQIADSNNLRIELVDLYSMTKNDPSLLLEDGIHISKKAHIKLAQKIGELLNLI